jgi:hypothetical protein
VVAAVSSASLTPAASLDATAPSARDADIRTAPLPATVVSPQAAFGAQLTIQPLGQIGKTRRSAAQILVFGRQESNLLETAVEFIIHMHVRRLMHAH